MNEHGIALELVMKNVSLLAAIAAGGSVTTALSYEKASVARGQELAQLHCFGCHTRDTQSELTIDGILAPSFTAIARQPSQTLDRVQSILEIPHRPMPAIPLSPADTRDIAAYVMSFRK
jgi:mono/diheme cytochrome c family protein